MIAVATWPLLLHAQAWLGGRRSLAVALMTIALLLISFEDSAHSQQTGPNSGSIFIFRGEAALHPDLVVPLYLGIGTIVENAHRIADWSKSLATLTIPSPPAWVEAVPVVGPKLAECRSRMHEPGAELFRPIRRRTLAFCRGAAFVLLATAARLAIALLSGWFFLQAPAAFAQDDEVGTTNREKLAREFTDPLTTLPQIFLQDAYTPANYGTDAQTNRVVARVIVPRLPKYSLLPFVQLVRPSFFLVTVPKGKGGATRTEFGDMQLFDVAVLPWPSPESGLRMAVGPDFVFPTATDKTAGQGAWQVGPTFAAIYKGVPWLLAGCLIQNPISFAYTSPDRQPVSTLLFQPVLLVALPGGWYVKSADASWTLSWRQGTPTLLPLSFGIGRVLVREGLPPINLFVSGEWTAYRQFAPVAPQTTVRFGMTVGFPDFRPWR